ncbi:unnamed protein product [Camellia sinensis]
MPSFIFNISTLKELYLDGNSLYAFHEESGSVLHSDNFIFLKITSQCEIPEEVGNLRMLEILAIQNVGLTSLMPSFIFNIFTLKELYLDGNSLYGSLPVHMCSRLPMLEVLSLSSNKLTGSIPGGIGKCASLRQLYLSENNFTEGSKIETKTRLTARVEGQAARAGSFATRADSLNTNPGLHSCCRISGLSPLHVIEFDGRLLQIISLSYNKFTGIIPRGIGNLTVLKELYLGDNNITGSIPEEIGKLLKMEQLILQFNNLKGPIPATIFNMSTLQIVGFSQNQLSGTLPSSIGVSLPNLERLWLGGNDLSGIVTDSISNASKLIALDLSSNRFSGSIPSSLGNLRLLEYLVLPRNYFTCESSSSELSFLTSLSSCRKLRELWINNNPLNGILPASIGNLSNSLADIDASYCGIRGSIPSEIENLSNLAFLRMNGNELTGFIPTTIKSLTKLQRLDLNGNRIQGFIPVDLCYLKNLGELHLGKNNLSGLIPACLGNITSLRYLDLDSNKLISSIPTSLWSLKDLLELNLSSNYLSGYLPLELGNLKVAIRIDLSMNQFSGQIPSTIGGLQGVINLSFAHNRLQGPIPQSIGSLTDLHFCDLSHNNLSGVIPKSLEALSQLRYFNVSFNRLIGEIPSRGSFANFTYQSFMLNEALCGAPRLQVPPCHTDSPHQSRTKQMLLVVYILLPIASTLLAMIFVFTFIRRRQRRNKIPVQTELLPQRICHERITYHELSRATNMFSESNLLGTGSFSSVYKGMLPGRTIFATKVFKLELDGAFKSFETECEILRNIRHRNLTKVISSCSTPDFKALVLEYMPNGTVEKWLYSHK